MIPNFAITALSAILLNLSTMGTYADTVIPSAPMLQASLTTFQTPCTPAKHLKQLPPEIYALRATHAVLNANAIELAEKPRRVTPIAAMHAESKKPAMSGRKAKRKTNARFLTTNIARFRTSS